MIPTKIVYASQAGASTLFKDRHIGRFRISGAFLRTDMASLLQMFALMVPIRCGHLFAQDTFEYVAYSVLFDKIPDAEEIPRYRIECEDAAPGQVVVRAVREDE